MDRLWAMEVFARVVECGSFSRAAASLDLANATVTACVRNLEKHLGATLIQRNTRHLHLTEAGTQFYPRCREVLQSVARAESEVGSGRGEAQGALRVEMPISIGNALICPALGLFAGRHPQVSLSVCLTNQPRNLIEHAIDIAIRMDEVEEADLVARPVYEARYVLCGAPALARKLPAHPAGLDPRLCLGVLSDNRRHPSDWRLAHREEAVHITPAGPLHFNTSDTLVAAALRGAGLICVLDVFVNPLIARGELAQVYGNWQAGARTFYAVTARTPYLPAKVRAFNDFLLEVLDAQRRPSARRQVGIRNPRRRQPTG